MQNIDQLQPGPELDQLDYNPSKYIEYFMSLGTGGIKAEQVLARINEIKATTVDNGDGAFTHIFDGRES